MNHPPIASREQWQAARAQLAEPPPAASQEPARGRCLCSRCPAQIQSNFVGRAPPAVPFDDVHRQEWRAVPALRSRSGLRRLLRRLGHSAGTATARRAWRPFHR